MRGRVHCGCVAGMGKTAIKPAESGAEGEDAVTSRSATSDTLQARNAWVKIRANRKAKAESAAQAAAGERADTRTIRDEAQSAPEKTLTQRVKSLFVGGGVLLIVVGLLRFGFDVLDLGTLAANDDVGSTRQAAKATARPSPIDPALAEADAGVAVVSGLKAVLMFCNSGMMSASG